MLTKNFRLMALFEQSSSFWVMLQYIFVRGIVGFKFIILARLLGPDDFGVVVALLSVIAVLDALSETGVAQALIQNNINPNFRHVSVVWFVQVFRGIFLSFIILVCGGYIFSLYGFDIDHGLLLQVSFIFLMRGFISVRYYLLVREHNFRFHSFIDVSAAFLDFFSTILGYFWGAGVASLLVGLIISDLFKVTCSWFLLRHKIFLNFKFSEIEHLLSFSRWMWAATVVSVFNNNFDKFIVGRWFGGGASLGGYQTSLKITQMTICDPIYAFAGYLFPALSRRYASSVSSAKTFFYKSWFLVFLWCALCVSIFYYFSDLIILIFLGEAWIKYAGLFFVLSCAQAVNALTAVQVVFLKSIGRVDGIFFGGVLQAFVLLMFYFFSGSNMGLISIAYFMLLISIIGWIGAGFFVCKALK